MKITLTKKRIIGGVYEGIIAAQAPEDYAPDVTLLHLGNAVGSGEVAEDAARPQTWLLRAPIPPSLLADGVQTFHLRDETSDQTLGVFTIVTGEPLEDDIRAEVDLLRAELDLLKRAFRRHCAETAT